MYVNAKDESLIKLDWRVSRQGWGTIKGNKYAEITQVRLLDKHNKVKYIFNTGEKMKVEVKFIVHKEIEDPHFGVALFREDGTYIYGPNTRFDGLRIKRLNRGEGYFSFEYKRLNLLPGDYRLSVVIWPKDEGFAYDYHEAYYKFKVVSDKKDHGMFYLEHKWSWRLP